MSLDIWLTASPEMRQCECTECGNLHQREVREKLFERNITHNLNDMASAAGLYKAMWRPNEQGWTKARDLIGPLETGLATLKGGRPRFEAMNPIGGWGKYENLAACAESYLAACRAYPEAEVKVSR